MPLTQKQLALAIALTLGVTNLQHAQARGDIEADSEWITGVPLESPKGHTHPTPPEPAIHFSFAGQATSDNGRSVGRMLDSVVDNLLASGELTEWEEYELENVAQELASLAPGRLGAVLEQLAGSQNANLGSATQNSLKQLNASLLSTMRQPDLNTQEGGRFWLQGLGNAGQLDSQRGSAGLQQRTQGLVIGADWAVDHAWRLGVMTGKSDTELNTKGFKGELDSWHLGGYAVRQDGPMALRLGAIYSNHAGQNKRGVDFDFLKHKEQLNGQYNAQSQNAFAEMGYQLDNKSVNIEPFAAVGYQRYHRDRYKEKGGVAALNVGAQTQENLSSTFGVRLAGVYRLDNQMSLTPHLSTSWKHLYGDVGSTVRQSSARLRQAGLSSDFSIEGTSLDRESVALRTGLDLALSAQHTVGLAYTAEVGSNSRNQGLTGQWAMAF